MKKSLSTGVVLALILSSSAQANLSQNLARGLVDLGRAVRSNQGMGARFCRGLLGLVGAGGHAEVKETEARHKEYLRFQQIVDRAASGNYGRELQEFYRQLSSENVFTPTVLLPTQFILMVNEWNESIDSLKTPSDLRNSFIVFIKPLVAAPRKPSNLLTQIVSLDALGALASDMQSRGDEQLRSRLAGVGEDFQPIRSTFEVALGAAKSAAEIENAYRAFIVGLDNESLRARMAAERTQASAVIERLASRGGLGRFKEQIRTDEAQALAGLVAARSPGEVVRIRDEFYGKVSGALQAASAARRQAEKRFDVRVVGNSSAMVDEMVGVFGQVLGNSVTGLSKLPAAMEKNSVLKRFVYRELRLVHSANTNTKSDSVRAGLKIRIEETLKAIRKTLGDDRTILGKVISLRLLIVRLNENVSPNRKNRYDGLIVRHVKLGRKMNPVERELLLRDALRTPELAAMIMSAGAKKQPIPSAPDASRFRGRRQAYALEVQAYRGRLRALKQLQLRRLTAQRALLVYWAQKFPTMLGDQATAIVQAARAQSNAALDRAGARSRREVENATAAAQRRLGVNAAQVPILVLEPDYFPLDFFIFWYTGNPLWLVNPEVALLQALIEIGLEGPAYDQIAVGFDPDGQTGQADFQAQLDQAQQQIADDPAANAINDAVQDGMAPAAPADGETPQPEDAPTPAGQNPAGTPPEDEDAREVDRLDALLAQADAAEAAEPVATASSDPRSGADGSSERPAGSTPDREEAPPTREAPEAREEAPTPEAPPADDPDPAPAAEMSSPDSGGDGGGGSDDSGG